MSEGLAASLLQRKVGLADLANENTGRPVKVELQVNSK